MTEQQHPPDENQSHTPSQNDELHLGGTPPPPPTTDNDEPGEEIPPPPNDQASPVADDDENDEMGARLERLGGEPAPDITPEEFARLQQSGEIHIDPRGRVRSRRSRTSSQDVGVSLRKRRAWYR